ncbi:MAG: sugar phosphate isomerase/epimerase [Lachnospiraceae bacterium]|nr:sugar phosphate isomerase/epimerase [Lachnospiraceae bacterium]
MKEVKKPILQIQPRHRNRDEWAAFAEKEDLDFEILELSALPALNESGLFEIGKEWYKKSKRVRSFHGVFIDINPASGDRWIRDYSREKCRESCRIAKEVGAENIVFHSSCFPFLRGVYIEGWSAQCAEFYEELADEFDMHVYIENSFDIDTQPLLAIMEVVKNEKVGVCLDLGHANYSGTPLEEWFELLGQWIGYIHLSDNMGVYDDHIPLGRGTVDWKKADLLYKSLDRRLPMTLEVDDIKGLKESLDFLKRNNYFAL